MFNLSMTIGKVIASYFASQACSVNQGLGRSQFDQMPRSKAACVPRRIAGSSRRRRTLGHQPLLDLL